MELTAEQIEKINKLAPMEWQTNEQGIFTEPYGIPTSIKEPVVYMRWHTGGVSGGSCWDSSNPQHYTADGGEPSFDVLDLVLAELVPSISYLQYKQIEKLVRSAYHTDHEYYGNSTDFEIKYVVLSELLSALEKL